MFVCVSLLGLFPCDTFAPTAVVPQGWPVGAPDAPPAGVFISPEATQPLQPTAGKLLEPFFIN